MALRRRRRLSVGAHWSVRFLALLGTSLTASVAILLVGALMVNARDVLREGAGVEAIVTTLLLLVFVVPGLYVLAAITIPMLGRLTSGVWLRRTKLRQRIFFETIEVDLAAADIQLGEEGKRLIARDPASGSMMEVPLRGEGSLRLPSAQLRAIAEAISHGQTRLTSTDDPLAVADELRALAKR